MKHIINLLRLSEKMNRHNIPNLYYHLNLTFKGVVGQLDEETLKKVKEELSSEHKKNVAFIDGLIKKGKTTDDRKTA